MIRPRLNLIALFVFIGIFAGLVPSLALAAGPTAQSAPVEGSIFPALLQIALVVLVTQGIKSLAFAISNGKIDLQGREAAYAYIIVGILVYAVQYFLVPALPPATVTTVTNFLGAVAIILGGSGLFSMTTALRVMPQAKQ